MDAGSGEVEADLSIPVAGLPRQLDHLVFAAPVLAEGVALIEHRLGVRMLPGGRHPQWGTANAILPIGPACYLEVIGPDPTAGRPDRPALFGLDRLPAPRLVTWAAKGTNLNRLVEKARVNGIDLGSPRTGSRDRADGTRLEWTLTDPFATRQGGVLPFFIDWPGSDHPARITPVEVELLSLMACHPDSATVRRQLTALELDLPVATGARPRFEAAFRTRSGIVVLN
jgi:hypothetical protein